MRLHVRDNAHCKTQLGKTHHQVVAEKTYVGFSEMRCSFPCKKFNIFQGKCIHILLIDSPGSSPVKWGVGSLNLDSSIQHGLASSKSSVVVIIVTITNE